MNERRYLWYDRASYRQEFIQKAKKHCIELLWLYFVWVWRAKEPNSWRMVLERNPCEKINGKFFVFYKEFVFIKIHGFGSDMKWRQACENSENEVNKKEFCLNRNITLFHNTFRLCTVCECVFAALIGAMYIKIQRFYSFLFLFHFNILSWKLNALWNKCVQLPADPS